MPYTSIQIEGGILSPDFLEILPEMEGQKASDFEQNERISLVDEVSKVWSDVRTYWTAFLRRKERAGNPSLTTITREQWVIPLLEALSHDVTFQRQPVLTDGPWNFRKCSKIADSTWW